MVGLGGGGATKGGAAEGVVDGALGGGDGARPDGAEVGAFGEVVAEKAVGVLHGAFLVGGVGVGVMKGAADDGLDFGQVEEFAAIIGEEAFHGDDAAARDELAEGAVDGFLGEGGEFGDKIVAGLAFDEDEEAAAFAGGGVDGVHLPVAEGLAGFPSVAIGDVVDEVAGFAGLGGDGVGAAFAAGLAAAEEVVVGDGEQAGVDVVVDGLDADGDAMLFAEVVGGGFRGHAEPADIVGEVLVDDGGDFATWAVLAFAFLTNGLGRAGAVAWEALRQGGAGFWGSGAPTGELIVERRRRKAKALGDPMDGVWLLQLTVVVPNALNDGAVVASQVRSGSLV